MLREFLDHIQAEKLLPPGSRALLALSGGLDSAVLLQLFRQARLPLGIAHCNFKLRGEESDEDARFVAFWSFDADVPFHSADFDTATVARQEGISIQMAARQLRYEWLEHIRRQHGYTHIATAHHQNDSIETLLYNLVKGCGIRGLHGTPLRNGPVIRPLLFAARAQLEAYARLHRLSWREDASNADTKYSRNLIRHEVIPVLKDINPKLEGTMAANIARFQQTEYLFDWAIARIRAEAVQEAEGRIILDIKQLKAFDSALETLLYELLSPYGFNAAQAAQMAQRLEHSGAIYHAPEYRLLIDRESLIVEPAAAGQGRSEAYYIPEGVRSVALPEGQLWLEQHDGRPVAWPADDAEALLDAEALAFPLRLRRWQPGDAFQPLGMGGQHQKVQDFFTNHKVSRFDKERAWVLEDAQGRICWLVGYRIDQRFCIVADTPAYWALKYENNAPLLG